MKKTYNSPVSKVVRIRVAQVMAASLNVSLNSSKSVDAASVDSRGDNSWDIWGNNDLDEE